MSSESGSTPASPSEQAREHAAAVSAMFGREQPPWKLSADAHLNALVSLVEQSDRIVRAQEITLEACARLLGDDMPEWSPQPVREVGCEVCASAEDRAEQAEKERDELARVYSMLKASESARVRQLEEALREAQDERRKAEAWHTQLKEVEARRRFKIIHARGLLLAAYHGQDATALPVQVAAAIDALYEALGGEAAGTPGVAAGSPSEEETP